MRIKLILKHSLLLLGLLQIGNLKSAGVHSESKEQAEAKAEATPTEQAKSLESKVKFYNSYEDYIKACKQKMKEVHEHLGPDVTGMVEPFTCISKDQWKKNNKELEKAIRRNDIGRVNKLLESGEVAINPAGGKTPLMVAVFEGGIKHNKVIELLISHGADINVKDVVGDTILTNVIRSLISNINRKNIEPSDSSYRNLFLKVTEGIIEKIRFLLSQKGININEKNENGSTALTVLRSELPSGLTEQDNKIIKTVIDLLEQAGAT